MLAIYHHICKLRWNSWYNKCGIKCFRNTETKLRIPTPFTPILYFIYAATKMFLQQFVITSPNLDHFYTVHKIMMRNFYTLFVFYANYLFLVPQRKRRGGVLCVLQQNPRVFQIPINSHPPLLTHAFI